MDRIEGHVVVPTDAPPTEPARLVDDFTPALLDVGEHNLCPGCGEPIAMRSVLEAIAELGVVQRTIAVFGIGCYTAFSNNLDVEVLQALHGRAVVRAEKGENRDDAGGALPVDRFGIEVVPRKRLGVGVLVDRVRGRRGAPRRGQDDRARRTVAADPTRRLGDDESRGCAQKGARPPQ